MVFRTILSVLMLLCTTAVAFAQVPPPTPPLQGAPLEGLSIVLLLTGAVYGSYRAKEGEDS